MSSHKACLGIPKSKPEQDDRQDGHKDAGDPNGREFFRVYDGRENDRDNKVKTHEGDVNFSSYQAPPTEQWEFWRNSTCDVESGTPTTITEIDVHVRCNATSGNFEVRVQFYELNQNKLNSGWVDAPNVFTDENDKFEGSVIVPMLDEDPPNDEMCRVLVNFAPV